MGDTRKTSCPMAMAAACQTASQNTAAAINCAAFFCLVSFYLLLFSLKKSRCGCTALLFPGLLKTALDASPEHLTGRGLGVVEVCIRQLAATAAGEAIIQHLEVGVDIGFISSPTR